MSRQLQSTTVHGNHHRPVARAAKARAARGALASPVALARHIIEFDSEDPSTYAAHTVPPAGVMLRESRSPIPWPAAAPTPAPITPAPGADAPLLKADYLIVTWTVEEAKALSDVLTPGFESQTAWYPYTHNFQSEFVPLIRNGAPSLESHRLGSYFPTSIGGKSVICMKSELHMSQDGPKLPIAKLWAQLIAECQPKLVITTGTAGGIGKGMQLGDVVVAPTVRFDCNKTFRSASFHDAQYPCSKVKAPPNTVTTPLFTANTSHLPPAARPPRVVVRPLAGVSSADVVTTDFFAFDDSVNQYELQGLGAAVEMGDAVLGLVISQMAAGTAPKWVAVRNASDPQIDATGLTPREAAQKAAQIYEKFGYWTTIPSAITCWAVVRDN